MQKTYVPTLERMLRKVLSYTVKHQLQLSRNLSGNQASSLGRINTEITTYFTSDVINEVP